MTSNYRQIRETSLDAYFQIGEKIKTRQGELYEFMLRRYREGKAPLTDYEMARSLGYADPNTIRPRRNELMKDGLVVEAGRRRCMVTGKTAITWAVSEPLNIPMMEEYCYV